MDCLVADADFAVTCAPMMIGFVVVVVVADDGAGIVRRLVAHDRVAVRVLVVEDAVAAVVVDAAAPLVELVRDVDLLEELGVESFEQRLFGGCGAVPVAEGVCQGPGGCGWGCEGDGFGFLDPVAVGAEGAVGDHGAEMAFGAGFAVGELCRGGVVCAEVFEAALTVRVVHLRPSEAGCLGRRLCSFQIGPPEVC